MPHHDPVSKAMAALVASGVASGWKDGVARATEAIDGSRAREVLEKLREETVERSKAEESKHESQPSTSTCE